MRSLCWQILALSLLLPDPAMAAGTPKTSGKHQAPSGEFKDCAACPPMIVVPGGRYAMGSPATEAGRDNDEGPQHEVAVACFAIGKFEVTQRQWRAVMGNNPSQFNKCGADCPVENVTWDEARIFVRKLAAKTGQRYRLPSEAEWEYACRANDNTRYCGGNELDDVGWHGRNSGGEPHPVGGKTANRFGLFDMSGNVLEWTQDCWHKTYTDAPADGSAWMTSGDCHLHVLRNGGFDGIPEFMRAANRDYVSSDLRLNTAGLRVVRDLP